MEYEIRPYQPEDYMMILRREFDLYTFGTRGKPEVISKQLMEGIAFTGICDKGLIACGGVMPMWRGVAEAWCVGSPLIEFFRFTFPKIVHKRLSQIINYYQLNRLQTIVHPDFKMSQMWLKRMGFKDEGPMENYIAGETFLRYAWIKR